MPITFALTNVGFEYVKVLVDLKILNMLLSFELIRLVKYRLSFSKTFYLLTSRFWVI